jgi:hypothetical protein
MKKVDYIAIMQEYHGGRNDGFLTDMPRPYDDDINPDFVRVRYDAEAMRWIHSRPSIKYPTARKLINQYRKEYAKS